MPSVEEILTPKARATRNALIDAARTVFERDGYLNARVTDIAAEAGLAHGSFYRYFKAKEDIFTEAIAATRAAVVGVSTHYPTAHDPAPGAAIARFSREYLVVHGAHVQMIALWEEVAHAEAGLRQMLRESQAAYVEATAAAVVVFVERGLAPAQDVEATAHAIRGLVSGFARHHWARSPRPALDLASTQLATMWLAAAGVR